MRFLKVNSLLFHYYVKNFHSDTTWCRQNHCIWIEGPTFFSKSNNIKINNFCVRNSGVGSSVSNFPLQKIHDFPISLQDNGKIGTLNFGTPNLGVGPLRICPTRFRTAGIRLFQHRLFDTLFTLRRFPTLIGPDGNSALWNWHLETPTRDLEIMLRSFPSLLDYAFGSSDFRLSDFSTIRFQNRNDPGFNFDRLFDLSTNTNHWSSFRSILVTP